MTGGFAEVAVQMFRRHVEHGFAYMGTDAVWMTPLCTLLLMAPVGAAMILGRAAARGRLPASWVVGVPSAIALLGLSFMLVHNRIHVGAQAILALGAARGAGSFAA